MARTPNENSKRQKAFKYLDGQTNKSREDAVIALKKKFTIGDSYAATLYQDHRKQAITDGKMTEVFVVRDTKDGKAIAPHITSHYVSAPAATDATTAAKAKTAYTTTLREKIAAVKSIK